MFDCRTLDLQDPWILIASLLVQFCCLLLSNGTMSVPLQGPPIYTTIHLPSIVVKSIWGIVGEKVLQEGTHIFTLILEDEHPIMLTIDMENNHFLLF